MYIYNLFLATKFSVKGVLGEGMWEGYPLNGKNSQSSILQPPYAVFRKAVKLYSRIILITNYYFQKMV